MRFQVEIPHKSLVLATFEELLGVYDNDGPWIRLKRCAESEGWKLEWGEDLIRSCSWVRGVAPDADPTVHEFLTAVEAQFGKYRISPKGL